MAVTRDATGAGGTTTGAACTVSHTIGTAGATTVVFAFVAISVSTNDTNTTCSATYGGAAMTQWDLTLLGATTSRSAYGIYFKTNPASGAQNCVVTPGGTSTKAGVAVSTVSYTGVGGIGVTQETAALSLSTTSVASGYNIFGHINGVTMTSPSQSQRVLLGASVAGVGDFLLVQDAAGTGSNITFSVSGTATTPSTFGVALFPVGAKADTLTDNFATQDNAKWTYSAGSSVVSGQLNITADATFANVFSDFRYDLTGSSITVEVPQVANGGADPGQTYLYARYYPGSNNDLLGFHIAFGLLRARKIEAGAETLVQTATYNATTHRWLRIRESSGNILWDYSANGLSWTNYRTDTTTLLLGSLEIAFIGRADTGSYTIIFDNFNLPPSAAPRIVANESLSVAVRRAGFY